MRARSPRTRALTPRRPGSELWTDEWGAYGWLSAPGSGYTRHSVTHARGETVDSQGRGTNAVEGLFSRAKRFLRRHSADGLAAWGEVGHRLRVFRRPEGRWWRSDGGGEPDILRRVVRGGPGQAPGECDGRRVGGSERVAAQVRMPARQNYAPLLGEFLWRVQQLGGASGIPQRKWPCP